MTTNTKKILITGSEGFAGQHLIDELVKSGYEVYGTTFSQSSNQNKIKTFVCDIESQSEISPIIDSLKPNAIVHLAGQPKPGLSFNIPQKTFLVNTIGTINLLEAVRSIPDYHPRILLVGTSEEHGIVSPKDYQLRKILP